VVARSVTFPDGMVAVPIVRRDLTMTGPFGAVIIVLGLTIHHVARFLQAALASPEVDLVPASLEDLEITASVMAVRSAGTTLIPGRKPEKRRSQGPASDREPRPTPGPSQRIPGNTH